ncbi:MAG: hypothetical protein ABIQ06_12865, partial [Caldimonas sp.]
MAIPTRNPNGLHAAKASVTPLPTAQTPRRPDRRLHLEDVLKLMLADGLLPAAQAEALLRSGRHGRENHPLVHIANLKLRNLRPP